MIWDRMAGLVTFYHDAPTLQSVVATVASTIAMLDAWVMSVWQYRPRTVTVKEHDYWAVGVACTIVACFGTVFGLLLQKLSHNRNESLPVEQQQPWYKRSLFWTSLVLMILVPAPLDMLSFGLTPQSLLAPLASVTLVLNVMFAPLVLGEKVTWLDTLGTLLIVVGACISTMFGQHSQSLNTVASLYVLFSSRSFLVCEALCAVIGVMLCIYIQQHNQLLQLAKRFEELQQKQELDPQLTVAEMAVEATSGVETAAGRHEREREKENIRPSHLNSNHASAPATSLRQTKTKHGNKGGAAVVSIDDWILSSRHSSFSVAPSMLLKASKQQETTPLLRTLSSVPSQSAVSIQQRVGAPLPLLPLAYGCLAAMLGVQQNLFTKTFAELVIYSSLHPAHETQMKYFLTYAVALVAAVCAVMQLTTVNVGLAVSDALLFLPIYNALLIVFGIFAGNIFFHETGFHASMHGALLFVGGSALVLLGLGVLTIRALPSFRVLDAAQGKALSSLPAASMSADQHTHYSDAGRAEKGVRRIESTPSVLLFDSMIERIRVGLQQGDLQEEFEADPLLYEFDHCFGDSHSLSPLPPEAILAFQENIGFATLEDRDDELFLHKAFAQYQDILSAQQLQQQAEVVVKHTDTAARERREREKEFDSNERAPPREVKAGSKNKKQLFPPAPFEAAVVDMYGERGGLFHSPSALHPAWPEQSSDAFDGSHLLDDDDLYFDLTDDAVEEENFHRNPREVRKGREEGKLHINVMM